MENTTTAVPIHTNTQPQVDYENLRRSAYASTIGSALEYYDFALYGLATSLILKDLFFNNLDSATGLIASFATLGVGFVARPLGGVIFGRIGDKYGRKVVLTTTILLMGGSSMLIGLLPTYNSIGILAPILLVILRLLQGLGAGAEQAGATVLMSEVSPPERRGFFSAIPFIGIQGGTLLAALVFALVARAPNDILMGWLWRVPFLLSVVLIGVGIYIRRNLKESPTFVELERHEQELHVSSQSSPHFVGNILRGIGLRMAENGGSYIFNSLAVAFVVGTTGIAKDVGAMAVATGGFFGMMTVPLAGKLSDKYGRRTIYRIGSIFMLLWALPAWYLLSLGNPTLDIFVIAFGVAVCVNTMLGAQCAYLPELFGNKHRYMGVALARELSAVLAGGLATFIGAYLIKAYNGDWKPMGLYLFVLALITFSTTFITPETKGRDLVSIEDAT